MTVDEAVLTLDISRRHIFRLLKAGALKRYKRLGERKMYLDAGEVRRLSKLQVRLPPRPVGPLKKARPRT